MLVIGISDLRHDSAAAVADRRGVVAAVEEEKLTRVPRAGGVPRRALEFCLSHAGSRAADASVVGVATRPGRAWLRDERLRANLLRAFINAPWRLRAPYGLGSLARVAAALTRRAELREVFAPTTRIVQFEHHLCHAASAYFASDFDRALVLTLDEHGDMWSGLASLGEGNRVRAVQPSPLPSSLGWMYTQVTELIGFQPHRDEHKTQWLSQKGEPAFIDAFRGMFRPDAKQWPILDLAFLRDQIDSGFAQAFYRLARIERTRLAADENLRAAIARSAQELLEESVVRLAEGFRGRTSTDALCLAGGVFRNALLVRAIERRTGFRSVFVQPAAGNAGTALGAAYLAQRHADPAVDRTAMRDMYLGPASTAADVKPVLDNCKVISTYFSVPDRLIAETVKLLLQHRVVGWYQGRAEFGHRALGNRTILASPFSPYVIENLNHYIKHREAFHPFALSVPEEDAATYFDVSDASRFMASVGHLKDSTNGLKQFAFAGGAIRTHTVARETNPRFWALLRRFGQEAPAPLLVNTSFNLFGEPLVCDPREAVKSFFCAGIDALVIEDFLVVK